MCQSQFWYEERVHCSNYGIIVEPYENIWTPQIFLVHTIKMINEIGKEGVMVRIENTGLVSWDPGQLFKCLRSTNVKYYPFGIQECEITFVS